MNDKYASDLPLPGGVEQYYDTLIALLRRVAEKPVTHDELVQVLIDVCPNASQSTAIAQYISLITRMGLWSSNNDRFRLTAEGTSLLEKADTDNLAAKEAVFEIKLRDVAGYDTLLKLLNQGSSGFDQLNTQLMAAIGANWKSRNQTNFRLSWLRSLGLVAKAGQQFSLTQWGSSIIAKHVITNAGSIIKTPVVPQTDRRPSHVVRSAISITERLQQASMSGGDGSDFESAGKEAFEFLGFSVEMIGGTGNPDLILTAALGVSTFRVLVEMKSRGSGTITQNDVNFNALQEHKKKANAKLAVVVANDFSGGNLEKWAIEQNVRLLRVSELKEVLLAHAECAIPLDRLESLFQDAGSTDEGMLSSLIAESETSKDLMVLCRLVYDAVLKHQESEATLNEHSLYYILQGEYSLHAIRATVEMLQSVLVAALNRTQSGGLYCRLSPPAFALRINQISLVLMKAE